MEHNNFTKKLKSLNNSILETFNLTTEKEIVGKFIEIGTEILGSDFGYSFIKAPGSNKFTLLYITPGEDYEPIAKPRRKGIVSKAYNTRQPQFINNISQDDSIRFDAKSAMRSVAVVPVTYKNDAYGTLHFAYYKTHQFTDEDKELFSYLGNIAAQSITIARLHGDLKDFKNSLDNTLDSIFIFDPSSLKILYVNKGSSSLTGREPSNLLQKTLPKILADLSENDLREKIEDVIHNKNKHFLVFESAIIKPDKRKVPVEIFLQYISHQDYSEKFLVIMRNTSERKRNERAINRMAYYDSLTGLPNRTLLKERLAKTHKYAEEHDGIYSLLFIDLDRFKVINDIYSHYIGDELLKSVSKRMKKILPSKATIARMGGDEFLVLLPALDGVDEAHMHASLLQKTFSEVITIQGQEIYSNGSIGYAIYPIDGMQPQTLLKHADLALHRAKDHGGGNTQQYREGQSLFYTIQPKLHSQLKQAIKKGELTLRYQPIISTKTQQIISCEALVRWNHPEMGMLFPGYFIGQAEESGLIVEIGEWVFNEACLQIKRWEAEGRIPVPVSVNISPRELLMPSLVSRIEQTLEEHEVSVSQIRVELTETFLMKDIKLSISILEQLKALGLSLSIDDFGTGYASLNYLKRLPIDTVKIDKSFIHGVPENLQDSALTSAIVTICHQLGLEVLAEGVETRSQYEYLRAIRCNYIQGNLFYRPVTGKKMAKLLKKTYLV